MRKNCCGRRWPGAQRLEAGIVLGSDVTSTPQSSGPHPAPPSGNRLQLRVLPHCASRPHAQVPVTSAQWSERTRSHAWHELGEFKAPGPFCRQVGKLVLTHWFPVQQCPTPVQVVQGDEMLLQAPGPHSAESQGLELTPPDEAHASHAFPPAPHELPLSDA